jgi:hypothetical protein
LVNHRFLLVLDCFRLIFQHLDFETETRLSYHSEKLTQQDNEHNACFNSYTKVFKEYSGGVAGLGTTNTGETLEFQGTLNSDPLRDSEINEN